MVISGQFLLDSESQLQEAVQKMLAARLQAKAGRRPRRSEQAGSGAGHEHGEQAVWTCPMHPQIVEHEPGTCPICGMDLVQKSHHESRPRQGQRRPEAKVARAAMTRPVSAARG